MGAGQRRSRTGSSGTPQAGIRNSPQRSQLQENRRSPDLTRDAIFARNLNNEIVFWNDAAEKLYGWTAQETRGKTTHEGQLIHKRRDGAPPTISSRWALRVEDGKPTAVLESNRDITHAKQKEKKFRNLRRQIAARKRSKTQP
jgi:PAS domain-containing protein